MDITRPYAERALELLDTYNPVRRKASDNARLKRKAGADFSISEYAIRRYELPLNRVIGDLLSPNGPHGQGNEFLKRFVTLVLSDGDRNIAEKNIQDWEVIPSYITKRGKCVDLVLLLGEVVVYIECKPWATESRNQLKSYAVDLYRRRETVKYLIFLPGNVGRQAESLGSICKDRLGSHFCIIPFEADKNGSIIDWLKECASATSCEAKNVRVFIEDLATYLDRQFGTGRRSMESHAEVVQDVMSNPDRLETLLWLTDNVSGDVKNAVYNHFIERLRNELGKLGEVIFNSRWPWHLIYFRKAGWPSNWAIGFGSDGNQSSLWIGFVFLNDREVGQAPDIIESLQKIGVPRNKPNDSPSYTNLPAPFGDWSAKTYLMAMDILATPSNQPMTEIYVSYFRILIDGVDQYLLKPLS